MIFLFKKTHRVFNFHTPVNICNRESDENENEKKKFFAQHLTIETQ